MNNLRIVEIELFSFCNRTCNWCPNRFIDRHSDNQYLDTKIFENLIKELKENYFHGVFSFSRYNEPFADFKTLNSRIEFIRSYFPNNKMVTNTNGDFVTKETTTDTCTWIVDEVIQLSDEQMKENDLYCRYRFKAHAINYPKNYTGMKYINAGLTI